MLERFAVFLDNPDSAYFPGQTVTGIVHVWNDQPKILKGLPLNIFHRLNFCYEIDKQKHVNDLYVSQLNIFYKYWE